ncbi:MAG TPA: undecaprenyl-diphosphate phosphatase [bacterium]|nr:undecaprenyl-diphosphate phosphatase [bacterium]
MLTSSQAVILGFLQGISELFPVSSLGHSVVLAGLLGWSIHQSDEFFLVFLVATHFATALVLFVFYRRDWVRIISGLFRSLAEREIRDTDPDARLAWLLVVGTIPAGMLGLLLEEPLRRLFVAPRTAAVFLAANGVLLFMGEALRRKAQNENRESDGDRRIARLGWFEAARVGVLQALALIPGFSRTGATLAGSLWVGLSHEDALRFSFLLATPIIGAAAVLKLPDLLTADARAVLGPAIIGAVCAAIGAYLSVRFLTRYFQTKTLSPFAAYCLLAGVLAFASLSR